MTNAKRNFLIGLAGISLALGLMSCDDLISGAKKATESDYTLTLAKTTDGQTYTAELYSNGDAVGGGMAQATGGSAVIKLSPYSGKPSFTGGTYTVRVTSGASAMEKASVAFTIGGNTQLDWAAEPEDKLTEASSVVYEGTTADGVTLKLTIAKAANISANVAGQPEFAAYTPKTGDTYVLTVGGVAISKGIVTVTADAETWEFKSEKFAFTARVKEDGLRFAGKITDEIDGDTLPLLVLTGEGENKDAVSYTLTLAKATDGQIYAAELYSNGEAVGGGAATAVGGYAVIKLSPYSGKPAFTGGTYTVRITAGASAKEAVYVDFVADGNTQLDWEKMPEAGKAEDEAIYGIRLRSDPSDGVIPSALEGYGTPPFVTITIGNEGNRDTGPLAITLEGTNAASFKQETASISNITAGGSSEFRVSPIAKLKAGTYSATVTVAPAAGNPTNIQPQTINVSFTVEAKESVEEPRQFSIELQIDGKSSEYIDFGKVNTNYTAPDARTVVIVNTSNAPIPFLTIALEGDTEDDTEDDTEGDNKDASRVSPKDAFSVSPGLVNNIQTGGAASFTVVPKSGLPASAVPYTATVRVSNGNDISASLGVSFTVEAKESPEEPTEEADEETPSAPEGGFTSLPPALAYLDAQTDGNSADNPVLLKLNFNLVSATGVWHALVNGLANSNKYVALDLSDSSVSNGEFNAGTGAGNAYIVSLILPDSATSVVAGSTSLASGVYASLKTVSGANITTIGTHAFYWAPFLTTVLFPESTSIGNYAFNQCAALTTASFPEVTSIGGYAFFGCTSLTTVSFPKATSIGENAFRNCTNLTTVSIPEVTSIGSYAFRGCTSLTTVDFPEVTSIWYYAFENCTSLTTVSIPKVTSIYSIFGNIGSGPLTITMGAAAPTGNGGIYGINGSINVTIRVPSGAIGYDEEWQEAFKGGSTYIILAIQYY